VLDADIRGFFDTIDHGWLVKFIEHRIGDKRIVRLIQKWLAAGILEDGIWSTTDEGTPQGATISPLLANIYTSLRVRPVGAAVEIAAGARRGDRRAVRR
jgi:retron-type reverse transcriptase